MSSEELQLDPNTASLEDLTRLPGVGKRTAERIFELRPLDSPEALLNVTGISTNKLEKLRPYLVFPEPEVQDSATDDLPAEEPAASEEQAIVLAEEAPEPEPRPSQSPGVTRAQAMSMAAAAGLFAFILGLAVTFSVLFGLNGGLRYAAPDAVSAIQLEIEGLNSQAETLSQDISGLRTRMDNMEALSGRVTTLEESSTALAGEIEALGTTVTEFQDSVEAVDGRVEALESQNENFQAFLNGLAKLLEGLTVPEEAGNE